MKKINLELPKYRLQLHVRLVKRRKPLLEDPILPTVSVVNKKYKKGTYVGRLGRYFADHKSIRKIFAANFVFIGLLVAFTPQTIHVEAQGSLNPVIGSETSLITQKGMQYPVENIRINQNYTFFHPGLDLGGKKGDAIRPVASGVVAYAGWDRSGYGNLVVLTHQNGLDSYYAHLSKVEVTTGQKVEVSTKIGQMGSTGHATGTHLHLEIHQNGASLSPLSILSR
jgi:murein DD-endopeptidase MepM/ murein hydrolase activator NlpD